MEQLKLVFDRYRLASSDVAARLRDISAKLSCGQPIEFDLTQLNKAREWLRQVDGTLATSCFDNAQRGRGGHSFGEVGLPPLIGSAPP